jgi:hypothetical protein
VVYRFGDTSKGGFGWSIDFGNGVQFEFGEWCEYIQGEFSNYREFRNLVNVRTIRQLKVPITAALTQVGRCLNKW